MRIDSSGNVQIGTTTPAYIGNPTDIAQFSVNRVPSSGVIANSSRSTALINLTGANGGSTIEFATAAANNIAPTERMRITSGGYVLAGTTATPSVFTGSKFVANGFFSGIRDGGTIFGSETTGGTAHGALSIGQAYAAGSANDVTLVLQNNAGQRIYVQNRTAGVYLADGGTSWTSNSDERLKENLVPITDAANKVSSLRAVTGNFIDDENKKSRAFLIAQDVQKVLPEAVDATDPEKLGVQYTDTIPLLVAAIKELNAKVEAQAAEIALLKSK
jgi:hypothetical protein